MNRPMTSGNQSKRRLLGSGLVEVLIALVVLSVGMLSIARLHTAVIKEGSTANNRAVAVKLAQTRLDQLRQFKYISEDLTRPAAEQCSQPNIACFDEIIAENAAAAVPNMPGFTWQVTDVTTNPQSKQVTVRVNWTDQNGPGFVALSSTIFAINYSAQTIGDGSGIGAVGSGPRVTHNPGATPEVVPIFVTGDQLREAQRPEPDINQSGLNTVTTFSVSTYNNSNNQLLQTQDFLTVNCTCVQAGDNQGREPSFSPNKVGAMVAKRTGTVKTGGQFNQQPAICTICCRDHHDHTAATKLYDPFRPVGDFISGSGDHNHYLNLVLANALNADYDEACRITRINGLWYATTDWNLAALVVAPRQYFETNLTAYQNAVAQFVKSYINAIDASYPQTQPSVTFNLSPALSQPYNISTTTSASPFELMARGIYIDHMTPEQVQGFKDKFGNDVRINLDGVPFQEVNVTRLATWSSSNTSAATVTNDALTDQSETSYTRGRVVKGSAGGTSTITATIKRSNTGLTASRPTDSHDQASLSGSVTVTTTGGTIPVTKYVWGRFDFGSNQNGVSQSSISAPTGTGSMACTVLSRNQIVPATGAQCGVNDGCYSCSTGDENWSGSINLEVITVNARHGVDYCLSPTPSSYTSEVAVPLTGNRTEYKRTFRFNNDLVGVSDRQINISFTNAPCSYP